jgi:hypothetical protein
VNTGCGPIVVTPPPTVAGFNIEYSFDDGVNWGTNTPPTAENCAGYKIKTRYVTTANCGSMPAGTVSTTGCPSPSTIRIIDLTPPTFSLGAIGSIICNPTQTQINAAVTIPTVSDNCSTGLTATFTDAPETGAPGCTRTIVRTWRAVDACGNMGTANQTITFTRDTQCRLLH